MTVNKRKKRSGMPQKRGVKRRERLLSSALDLLGEFSFDELSYKQIADGAGVPMASCYNFYKNKLELVRILADELTDNYLESVMSASSFADAKTWQDCISAHVNHSVEHHNKSAAELKIFFSGDVSLKLRQDALKREKLIGLSLFEILRTKFEVPKMDNADDIFFRAVEIARTVLALDFQETGELSDASAVEAVRAMSGYLANYLPPVLPPREADTD